MLAVPAVTPTAKPGFVEVFETVATVVSLELHATTVEIS
jgi:hypothetical protein